MYQFWIVQCLMDYIAMANECFGISNMRYEIGFMGLLSMVWLISVHDYLESSILSLNFELETG
jgi:hypothetical protein